MTDEIKTGPKVVEIGERDKIKAENEEFKRAIQSMIDNVPLIVRLRRAHYNEAVKQGFTSEQALILCQKVTM